MVIANVTNELKRIRINFSFLFLSNIQEKVEIVFFNSKGTRHIVSGSSHLKILLLPTLVLPHIFNASSIILN